MLTGSAVLGMLSRSQARNASTGRHGGRVLHVQPRQQRRNRFRLRRPLLDDVDDPGTRGSMSLLTCAPSQACDARPVAMSSAAMRIALSTGMAKPRPCDSSVRSTWSPLFACR
jgi:hypothetical protein